MLWINLIKCDRPCISLPSFPSNPSGGIFNNAIDTSYSCFAGGAFSTRESIPT